MEQGTGQEDKIDFLILAGLIQTVLNFERSVGLASIAYRLGT